MKRWPSGCVNSFRVSFDFDILITEGDTFALFAFLT